MDNEIKEIIEGKIKNDDLHLFMKGTPLFPQCGFSSTVVQILTYLEAPFSSTNVLEDENIREGVKEFSNWPTIPQLYYKGEFIGGCDIIKEMFEKGELKWEYFYANKNLLETRLLQGGVRLSGELNRIFK